MTLPSNGFVKSFNRFAVVPSGWSSGWLVLVGVLGPLDLGLFMFHVYEFMIYDSDSDTDTDMIRDSFGICECSVSKVLCVCVVLCSCVVTV